MTDSTSNTADTLSESIADAVEHAAPAVVAVHGRKRLPGSGIVWSPESNTDAEATIVVTASHVVETEDRISVRLPDRSFREATLLGRDIGRDLAILRVDGEIEASATVRERPTRVGNLVVAVGRPFPPEYQATIGSVHAIGSVRFRRSASDQLIRSSVTMLPGFSGGPLLDLAGAVIGVNTSGLLWAQGATIPAHQVSRVAADIMTHGRVRVSWIGVSVQRAQLAGTVASQLDDQDVGLLVTGIAADSPAATASVLVGDVLIALGDHPLLDTPDLQMLLSNHPIDEPVELALVRGGERAMVTVTPGERPGCG